MVTSDHSPLPVCRDGSQARRTKECVLFSLKATERAGWRKNTTCPFGSRSQIQGRVLLLTTCAAGIGGTFQFGYNLSIINAPTLPIQEFINETWWLRTGQPLPDHLVLFVWSLIVSLYPLGGLFGALLAGPLAVLLGRKKSLLVNNVFVVAAATLFGFSRRAGSFEMIVLGRLLMGVSAGLSMNVQPMYLGESAPKELRGAVAMTPAIFTALGIVIGQVVGLSPAAAAGHCRRGGGAGRAGGGAGRLPGPARPAPLGAVPGSQPAEAGDEPHGAGQCRGALRERLGVRIRLLSVPGSGDPRGEGPVRSLGDWELRAACGLPQLCADREVGPPRAADRRVLPDDLLGKYFHRSPMPAELLPLDALPGHVLHLCLRPQLWHWSRPPTSRPRPPVTCHGYSVSETPHHSTCPALDLLLASAMSLLVQCLSFRGCVHRQTLRQYWIPAHRFLYGDQVTPASKSSQRLHEELQVAFGPVFHILCQLSFQPSLASGASHYCSKRTVP
ncbi:solute carrier family 2, facilitated glucose transporter member 11 isoform X6 [Meles meles]|uniref:solute carrier family 2, facilitated glucose transporter member 11 isoform X6 n=1 Tax=Meles meles TaxID=9662 RepID=UPI001E69C113|nr:solute carrier family 2, facilitated glucose transporter member 11 isoform X6 [Meles meles]